MKRALPSCGVAVDAPKPTEEAAPPLVVEGMAVLGGVAVGTKPSGP